MWIDKLTKWFIVVKIKFRFGKVSDISFEVLFFLGKYYMNAFWRINVVFKTLICFLWRTILKSLAQNGSSNVGDLIKRMTFLTPLDDLGWPRDAHHWIQGKISSRMVCISCAFGRISDFRPQMTFFDPVRWPRMTSRCTPLNSEENFQPNGMHIMCISLMAEKKRSDHCFDHKWSISGHSGTFLGRILYISRISSLRRFEWYPFQPLAEKSVFACRSLF